MRELIDEDRIRRFMRAFGQAIDFIPVADGWEDRSRFIAQEGPLSFYNFDLTAQALAKIERGHTQDMSDVRAMIGRGLVTTLGLRQAYDRIEPLLYRYPAVDPASFRSAVEAVVAEHL